jgi:hypothetical protein
MNQNEIIEMKTPAVSKHPAHLILEGVQEQLNAFENEHQQLVQQLQNKLKEIERLKREVQKQGLQLHQAYQEKKVWLNQLIAYWQREVDLVGLATQMQGDLSPEQRKTLLEQMQQLNQTNVKFAHTYQPKSKWGKKVFYSLITLLLLILGAYGLRKLWPYLRPNSNN